MHYPGLLVQVYSSTSLCLIVVIFVLITICLIKPIACYSITSDSILFMIKP